jgi:uncharacterized protein (DUF2236 family)
LFQALYRYMQAPPGLEIDFTQPAWAPALTPADGISWQIFANPMALFIGGVSAVLLELAEPAVRSGVWEHSDFRLAPAQRLHRTGYAAMVTVYAPREAAEKLIAQVGRLHAQVRGQTPDGRLYRASDPALLNWVQSTAIFGFAEAFHRFVRPLSPAERDAAFQEGQTSARLYGANALPHDWAGWQQQLPHMASALQPHPILAEFLQTMQTADLLPPSLRPLQRLLVRAAVDITPAPVRQFAQLQGQGLRRWERPLVRLLGRAAGLMPLPQFPPAQARKRMHMPRQGQ